MSGCINSVHWSLPNIELHKFCPPVVSSVRLEKFCPPEVTQCYAVEILPTGGYSGNSIHALVGGVVAHCHVKICLPGFTWAQMMKLTEAARCQVWKTRLQEVNR